MTHLLPGLHAAAASFTDYIEFQHSDESIDGHGDGSEAEESLLFPGGDSSHLLQENKSFFRLLKDVWRVRLNLLVLRATVLKEPQHP